LLTEIGRGGMGVVYRARDLAFDRDVAIKLLSDGLSADSAAARRFSDEARITAQLQHPAIPPVFEVGALADGRPYLAMKLIKGETLEELLAVRRDPGDDRGRILAAFEAVCQAVAYAHSKHVIHRDLKPANVMVGAFGEVQVMDWGLAKVADPNHPAPAGAPDPQQTWTTRIVSTRDADSDTQVGSLMGTPAFMPPEQAAGAVDLIGPRSDVFGLGAILAVLLTGKPPYTGDSSESVRLAAIQGKVAAAFERLDACGAEAELVDLCKQCLATDAGARPADAGEVAEAVRAFRAEAEARAHRAEVERERAAVRESERRKRRRLLAAAAVGLVVVGGLAAWMVRQRAEDRAVARARADEVASAALAEADGALKAGKMVEVDTALARAETRIDEAGRPDLRDRYDDLRRDRDVDHELEEIAERRWSVSGGSRLAGTDPAIARWFDEAFRRYGIRIGEDDPAQSATRIGSSRISTALVAGLNEWFFLTPEQPGLLVVLERTDQDRTRTDVRAVVAAKKYDRVRELAAAADGATLTPGFAVALGMHPALSNEQGYRLMRAAWDAHPDSFGLALRIGSRVGHMGEAGDAERAAEAAAWNRTAIALRPNAAVAYNNLGVSLLALGDLDGQEAAFRKAIRLAPNLFLAHHNLFRVLVKRHELDRALVEARHLVEKFPTSNAAHRALSDMLLERKDYPAAAAAGRKAVELAPNNPESHRHLGFVLQEMNNRPAAAAEYRASAALRLPGDPWRLGLAGWAMRLSGDNAGAADEYRKALEIAPDDVRLRNDLAHIQIDLKDFGAAEPNLRRIVELDPRSDWAYNQLGRIELQHNNRAAAADDFRRAIELNPRSGGARHNLVVVLTPLGRVEEARAAWEQALRHDPPDHAQWYGYAELCLYLGREDDYRRARSALLKKFTATTDPNVAERTSRTCLLLPAEGKEFEQAVALADRAVAVGPGHRDYRYFLAAKGLAEYRRGNVTEALANLRQAQRLRLTSPVVRPLLALALSRTGKTAESRSILGDALASTASPEATGDDPDAWIDQTLCREAEAAILPNLPTFLTGKYEPTDDSERLAFAGACVARGRNAAAVRLYTAALATDPKLMEPPRLDQYNAACIALRAASGHGSDAPTTADARAELRRQAHAWLTADLSTWEKFLTADPAKNRQTVQRTASFWLADSDLAPVRDPSALTALPADERAGWERFWADTRALTSRAGAAPGH
jgi:tetratricopeptide (TPR) repeat protein